MKKASALVNYGYRNLGFFFWKKHTFFGEDDFDTQIGKDVKPVEE